MIASNTILPPATLGMLGGGQLGRFFVIAAHEMGYKVVVLDPDRNSPAGKIADLHICAAFDDQTALNQLAQECAAISTEFENVPAATLEFLAQQRIVRPAAAAVAIAQNRVAEKNFIRDAGLPVAPYAVINAADDIPDESSGLYPAILKVARFGYDGKGQARVATPQQAREAFANFKAETCVLERMLKLDYEVSLVLARDAAGHVAAFPLAENQHLNGILDVSIVPARADAAIRQQAEQVATEIAVKLDYVGVIGVEFFVSEGRLLVNEMAPRPHNSGHYTLDGCVTDQFEQQVRVLAGLPLGDARLHSPAVMVNLLGDIWAQGEPAWEKAYGEPGLKMHFYGKHEARPGRKMGHYTVVGESAEDVLAAAMRVRDDLGVGK